MKKIVTMSFVTAMAISSTYAMSDAALAAKLNALETELATVKKDLAKQNKKISEVKSHDANDNIKWGVDFRTAIDNISYDMADGSSRSNSDLMSMRLWLNMAYAVDSHNIFKGQLSMNKAFGADFGTVDGNYRTFGLGSMFDWTGNEALSDNTLHVRQAYWLYLGDDLFGANVPWTFSIGRRPSTGGFLANLREDDDAQSPLGHVINLEFDGLSTKVDLSNVTGIPGMSLKLCAGRGTTNATPMFSDATSYAENNGLDDVDLAGFIFVPYDDGQFIVKTNWFKAFDLPGMTVDNMGNPSGFEQYGDMQGAAISVMVDGLTEDGYFSDAKVFGSFAWTQTDPDGGKAMLGSTESESGTSYWLGAQLPVTDKGVFGMEYNHGSKYWRPFTYAEDTMIGSKIAARGDAYEAYFTYQLTDALSAQLRYTKIDYEYSGSNGFFGNTSGYAMKIDDIKANAAWAKSYLGNPSNQDPAMIARAHQAIGMEANTVESAENFRFYIRYKF